MPNSSRRTFGKTDNGSTGMTTESNHNQSVTNGQSAYNRTKQHCGKQVGMVYPAVKALESRIMRFFVYYKEILLNGKIAPKEGMDFPSKSQNDFSDFPLKKVFDRLDGADKNDEYKIPAVLTSLYLTAIVVSETNNQSNGFQEIMNSVIQGSDELHDILENCDINGLEGNLNMAYFKIKHLCDSEQDKNLVRSTEGFQSANLVAEELKKLMAKSPIDDLLVRQHIIARIRSHSDDIVNFLIKQYEVNLAAATPNARSVTANMSADKKLEIQQAFGAILSFAEKKLSNNKRCDFRHNQTEALIMQKSIERGNKIFPIGGLVTLGLFGGTVAGSMLFLGLNAGAAALVFGPIAAIVAAVLAVAYIVTSGMQSWCSGNFDKNRDAEQKWIDNQKIGESSNTKKLRNNIPKTLGCNELEKAIANVTNSLAPLPIKSR